MFEITLTKVISIIALLLVVSGIWLVVKGNKKNDKDLIPTREELEELYITEEKYWRVLTGLGHVCVAAGTLIILLCIV